MNTVRKFKLFWAWQDEQEEEWLHEMSRQGMHMRRVTFPGFYEFMEGEPAAFVYRLDFKTSSQKDMQEYLQLFQDAGWEYLGRFISWQYFRKEAKAGEVVEIYTDADSKIEKYSRLMWYLAAFIPLWTVNLINVSKYPFSVIQVLVIFVFVLYLVAVIKIWQRIQGLKKRA